MKEAGMEAQEATAATAAGNCRTNDWVGTWRGWAIWGSALVMLILGGHFSGARTWLWFFGFLAAGAACVINAARCGRRHCYFTGPALLLGAGYMGLVGLHFVAMNENLVLNAVAGVAVLGCLMEHSLGRYAKRN